MKIVVFTSLTLDGVMQGRAGRTRTAAADSSTAAGRSPTLIRSWAALSDSRRPIPTHCCSGDGPTRISSPFGRNGQTTPSPRC